MGRKPPSSLSQRFMKYLQKAKANGWQNPLAEVITRPVDSAPPYFLIPVYTIRNGHLTRLNNHILGFASGTETVDINGLPLHQSLVPRMRRFLQCIHSLSRAVTQYGQVVRSLSFPELYYCRGAREIAYSSGRRSEEAFACSACGIVLPLWHMEIDHQRPRKGGELEALAKTMRVLGLTLAGPHGGKCVQLHRLVQEAMNNNANMGKEDMETLATDEGFVDFWQQFDDGIACDCLPEDVLPHERTPFEPVVPKPARGPAAQTSTVQERYTLNREGEVLYSFIRALGMEKLPRATHEPLASPPHSGELKNTKRSCLNREYLRLPGVQQYIFLMI
ncbi:hypothetical protein CMUS01_02761 [Colletotrichum musicola]|uniref:Uncharacterized protein n=1 Tax=Colletotrichum musicola TaxID=2175873 RepID=A0A8H6NUE7_9PEZI|nr:hypothetical protein CMUS01_02761 [Colletotrichum musicola]